MIMNQPICVLICVALTLGTSYLSFALSEKKEYKFLKFSNQSEPPVKESVNFATLKYGGSGKLSRNQLTICGSIYIPFYRGLQTFYVVSTNTGEKLWLSLKINNQDTTEEIYTALLSYYGGSVLSIAGAKLRLNPHAWSHACTSVDGESGAVMVVINGVLAFNATIRNKEFS